jgi:hypothetical protein
MIKIAFISLLLLNVEIATWDPLKFMQDDDTCWVKAYGRGMGTIPDQCPEGEERSGLLCYPKCQDGYTGIGPVCWQDCPNNFRDDIAYCFKPEPYGRGVGYPLSQLEKCQQENPQGCEQYELLFYPRCKASFHNVGCCICSPDCPEGMTDIGISCAKKSYTRGQGTPMICKADEVEDTGLCYKPCKDDKYTGIGPICWDECPEEHEQCGALCLKDEKCTDKIQKYFDDAFATILAFLATDYEGGFINFSQFIKELSYPICTNPDNYVK